MWLSLLATAGLVTSAPVSAQVSFEGIAPSTSVTTSRAALQSRMDRVLQHVSAEPLGPYPGPDSNHVRFTVPALAKLRAGSQVRAVNQAILQPSARAFGKYGTKIRVLRWWCERDGDYDFVAQDLVRLAYTNLDSPRRLWPRALRKLAFDLLPAAGARHHTRFRLGVCGVHRETENHILMTESSRYLTNQLRRRLGADHVQYDNRRNGFDAWMLRHLSGFVRRHFEEYNSLPYQGYTVNALNNLHSFSESPRVVQAAQIVLDYLSAVFAVQSNGLRRYPPFRRKPHYADSTRVDHKDAETARFAVLAGNYGFAQREGGVLPYGAHFMLNAALSDYRVPDSVLDLVVRKQRYFQRLHHQSVEVYAGSPSFLISGGGTFVRHFQGGSDEQHGWARPLVVIPSADRHVDARYWLRVVGADDPRKRNNTCVAPGFACGLDVRVPDALPAGCSEQHGRFQLLNFTAPACKLDYGYYAAVYRAPCTGPQCRRQAASWGFMELAEARELSFERFRERTLDNNAARRYRASRTNRYITHDGREILFVPAARPERWPIVKIAGKSMERKFSRWPLAQGDVLNASGDGLVTVDNPERGTQLVLDLSDPDRPRRFVRKVVSVSPGPPGRL